MRPTQRLELAVAGLAAVSAIGAIGFRVVEGLPWIDAVYMAVITISTVGFAEVQPLSTGGRLFTIGLIAVGVGTSLYLMATVAELLIEGRIRDFVGRRRMQREIERMENHVIVCGFGRLGEVVVDELRANGVRVVVIEKSLERQAELERAAIPYVAGSALDDRVLEEAGVRAASAIIIATATDADNVFITLAAREANPGIAIRARGESAAGERRLIAAGANQVISAYRTGGHRLAHSLLRPSVVDFLEISHAGRHERVDLEEVRVESGCR